MINIVASRCQLLSAIIFSEGFEQKNPDKQAPSCYFSRKREICNLRGDLILNLTVYGLGCFVRITDNSPQRQLALRQLAPKKTRPKSTRPTFRRQLAPHSEDNSPPPHSSVREFPKNRPTFLDENPSRFSGRFFVRAKRVLKIAYLSEVINRYLKTV